VVWLILGIVVFVLVGAPVMLAYTWRKDMPKRSVPEDALVARFIGGVKWSGGNATVPLAKLEVHQWGFRIAGSWGPLGRILPQWDVLSGDIKMAQVGKSRLGGTGLVFQLQDGTELTFWTSDNASVCTALKGVGIEVDQTTRLIPFTYPSK
jgi:hypothetical protein